MINRKFLEIVLESMKNKLENETNEENIINIKNTIKEIEDKIEMLRKIGL